MSDEITVMAHVDTTWPKSYRMTLAKDGREIATGRNPLKATAERLLEEGLAHPGRVIRMRYVDARPEERLTISEALEGVSL